MALRVDASFVKSVAVHLGCLLLIVFGANFALSKPKPQDTAGTEVSAPVEAVAIDQQQLNERVQQLQREQAEAKATEERRIRELERRAQQAEQSRAAEERRIQRLAEEKKRADEEARKSQQAAAEAKRRQEQEAAKAREAEQARIVKEQERKKAEDAARAAEEKRKAEQAAAEKAAAEKKRQQEEARRRAEQEKAMQEQMAQEASARRAARAQQAATEVQRYTALIRDAVNNALIKDESMRGKSCLINIKLATNGFVTSVKEQGGDRNVCAAAERAINRIGTMPMSSDPDVYEQMKDITLRLEPQF